MRNSTKLLTLAALSASFSTAFALDAPPLGHIRCLIVGSRLGSRLGLASDPDSRAAGQLLAIYSMALMERFSSKEIEDAMFSESYAMTNADYQTDVARCKKILVEKGQEMSQIGTNLERRGEEMKNKKKAPPASAPAAPASSSKE
jgi:hypothetical protein